MYKVLLCWRYLRTRYIALASVISVMLGVATMIVVNSVMEGFTTEMQQRLHGILSDVVFESRGLNGFEDPERHMEEIRKVAGRYIAAMTPTVHVPAMISIPTPSGENITKPIMLIGIEPATYPSVGDFIQFLQHPENRKAPEFTLRDGGYDVRDHQGGPEARLRPDMEDAGWKWRRKWAQWRRLRMGGGESATQASTASGPVDPFGGAAGESQGTVFDPERETFDGIVLGIALASFHDHQGVERFFCKPGEDVVVTYPVASTPPRADDANFTVVDFYESKMSEFDASYAFAPLSRLQQLLSMIDPESGRRAVSAIQIRLHHDEDGAIVRDLLRAHFPANVYAVSTWRDKQGPLLAAVQMETSILNILLFLIIAVAGFGILAIFYMIVVEKTRDIGILKALGASSGGILSVFLAYGVLLGGVGAGVGTVLGLLFVANINEIADLIGQLTGHEVFDPSIYYFYRIPTIVEPFTVTWIVCGAVLIAVLASILPARRASRLHPVEALRYE
jgi:lipoprotein-releasing system permease protein